MRTPFAKRRSDYSQLSALSLAKLCVAELLQRAELELNQIDGVVFGKVMPACTNIARDVVVGTGLPREIDAFSVARACATSHQATISAAQGIELGKGDCMVVGGADSASDVPLRLSRPLAEALERARAAASLGARVSAFRDLDPSDLAPVPPTLSEPSSDLTMGEAAEKMAKENAISRTDQDDYAHRSHRRAASAWEAGAFDDQVMTLYVPPDYRAAVRLDGLVRFDSDREAYATLAPAFDKDHGSVTAGNSSPLSDGAAALLVMSRARAQALGRRPLGYVKSFAFASVDPEEQMLIGPVRATQLALERAGIQLEDLDLIDMHEAFAAQILSVVRALQSDTYAREHLGRDGRIGEVNMDRFNVSGGSIALGHPFAATGARQIMQCLHDLRRLGGELALCSACAAGGLAAAIVLEAA